MHEFLTAVVVFGIAGIACLLAVRGQRASRNNLLFQLYSLPELAEAVPEDRRRAGELEADEPAPLKSEIDPNVVEESFDESFDYAVKGTGTSR